MMQVYQTCPRCKKSDIRILDDRLLCYHCGAFEKSDLALLESGQIDHTQLMTIKEKNAFIDILGIDPEQDRDIFE